MQENIYGNVYKVTNANTGEFYIGASIYSPNNRLSSHKHRAKTGCTRNVLAVAIRKHGAEHFNAELITKTRSERHLRLQEELYFLEGKLMHPTKCLNSNKFIPYVNLGEHFKGSKNGRAKLTEEQVTVIARTQFKQGQKAQLAKLLKVTSTLIYSICNGVIWKDTTVKAKQLPPLTYEEALKLLT